MVTQGFSAQNYIAGNLKNYKIYQILQIVIVYTNKIVVLSFFVILNQSQDSIIFIIKENVTSEICYNTFTVGTDVYTLLL